MLNNKQITKKYYVLHHYFYGCEHLNEQFVYDEFEFKSSKIQKYINTHRYKNYKIDVYCYDLKKWTVEDVLQLEESNGWTPAYLFVQNGFELLGEIDLVDIFDKQKMVKEVLKDGTVSHSRKYSSMGEFWDAKNTKHNLYEKKQDIQQKLEQFEYSARNLLIFRTTRRSLFSYWDVIQVFSEGDSKNVEKFRNKLQCGKVR